MLNEGVDKCIHIWEDVALIGRCGENELAVAESILESLGHIVAREVADCNLGAAELFELLGRGTATQNVLDLLGLSTREYHIVMTIADRDRTAKLIEESRKHLYIDAPGQGIIAATPIKSVGGGKTLSYLMEYLKLNGARSVKTCTLLDKPSRRQVDFTPDYCGAEIPDHFVVGYGLDYAELYRTLPFVGILKPEVYEK